MKTTKQSTMQEQARVPVLPPTLLDLEIYELVFGVLPDEEHVMLEEILSEADRRQLAVFEWFLHLLYLTEVATLRAQGHACDLESRVLGSLDSGDWESIKCMASRELIRLLEAAEIPLDESKLLLEKLRAEAGTWFENAQLEEAEPSTDEENLPAQAGRHKLHKYLVRLVRDYLCSLDEDTVVEILGPSDDDEDCLGAPRGNNPREFKRTKSGELVETDIDPSVFKIFARTVGSVDWRYVVDLGERGDQSAEDAAQEMCTWHLWGLEMLIELTDSVTGLALEIRKALGGSYDEGRSLNTLLVRCKSARAELSGWVISQLENRAVSDEQFQEEVEILSDRLDCHVAMIEELRALQRSNHDGSQPVPPSIAAEHGVPRDLGLDEAMFWAYDQLVRVYLLDPNLVPLPPELDEEANEPDAPMQPDTSEEETEPE